MVVFETEEFEVDSLDRGDASQLVELYRQCEDFLALGPVSQASLDLVETDMAQSRSLGGRYCAIRDREGNAIGVLDFAPNVRHGVTFIELLMIGTPWRRSGVGRAIVTALERHLREHCDTQLVESAVQTNNPDGMEFWSSMGYERSAGAELQPDTTVTYRLWKDLTDASEGSRVA